MQDLIKLHGDSSRPSYFLFLRKMYEIHGIAVLKRNSGHKNDVSLMPFSIVELDERLCADLVSTGSEIE